MASPYYTTTYDECVAVLLDIFGCDLAALQLRAYKVPAMSATQLSPMQNNSYVIRNSIPSLRFPAETNRYVLYVNSSCPWAHRTIIVHALKRLEGIVEMVEVDARDPTYSWYFSGKRGPAYDPITGYRWLRELYLKADPHYAGRISVPVLWDKKDSTVVNNDSAQIIRIFFEAFDPFLPPLAREINKGASAFIPRHLRPDIEALNAWVYDSINNGVYRVGFSNSDQEYKKCISQLFEGLDRLEHHLAQPGHHPYLFGAYITEADIRLFVTLIRFDVVYYNLFNCNLKMIRYDYPRLHDWLRLLYWSTGPETGGGVFRKTTYFDDIKDSYALSIGSRVRPMGPTPDVMPL